MGLNSSSFSSYEKQFSISWQIPHPSSTFQTQFACQIHSIHIIVFYLILVNQNVPMDTKNEVKIFAFFSQYMLPEDTKTLCTNSCSTGISYLYLRVPVSVGNMQMSYKSSS